ncbi:hypothetical protein FRC09_006358 [Ceratobasidium sp. 395]|nr:hypothetical protein FRC09_006358 [Ceratobasidium sp. 395]
MGIVYSIYCETFPGKPDWSVDQIPDLTGQTMVVTGGNAGIGRETCKVLLNRGAKVYLAARSKSKADKAIEWLKNETNGRAPVFLQLDLADLASIRRAAGELRQKETELHVLFNNAGVMVLPVELKTVDGYDLQFGTNVLGHYLFTTLLLPTLIHTAQINGTARIVNTSSGAHWAAPSGGINYATLPPNDPEADKAPTRAKQGIICTSLHPGSIRNEWHNSLTGIWKWIVDMWVKPTSWGALTQLYAGTAPEGSSFSGKYLIPWGRVSTPRPGVLEPEAGQQLWTWLEEQTKQRS